MTDQLTFEEVQRSLSFGAFMELQRDLLSPEVKVWRRKVLGVSRVKKGGDQSKLRAIMIKYEPIQPKNPQHTDPGTIETGLTGPGKAPELVGQIAKESIGKWCTFYQSNTAKSEDNPHGFRQLVWIEPDSAAAPASAPQPAAQQQQRATAPAPAPQPAQASTAPAGETPSQRARREFQEQQQRPFDADDKPREPHAPANPVQYDPAMTSQQQAATNLGHELREQHAAAREQAKQLQPGEEPF